MHISSNEKHQDYDSVQFEGQRIWDFGGWLIVWSFCINEDGASEELCEHGGLFKENLAK